MKKLIVNLVMILAVANIIVAKNDNNGNNDECTLSNNVKSENTISCSETKGDEWSYYSHTTKFKLERDSYGNYSMIPSGSVDIYTDGSSYGTQCKLGRKVSVHRVSRNSFYGSSMDNCPQSAFEYITADGYYININ
ncbi:MAG: hypothetical protein IJ213_00095 [Bacteroidales bacterium]|nr:hypothetical protein [Bacteroidales bacterium]